MRETAIENERWGWREGAQMGDGEEKHKKEIQRKKNEGCM